MTAIIKQESPIETQEFKDISTMIEDCPNIVVTYALNDQMKMTKIVTFYDLKKIQMDGIVAGHGWVLRSQGDFRLHRSFLYKIKNKLIKAISYIRFHSVLLKDVPGFVSDYFTQDKR